MRTQRFNVQYKVYIELLHIFCKSSANTHNCATQRFQATADQRPL